MMKERLAVGASVISAITASLCCIGPLVAGLLGLGTLSMTALFEAWRPYFLGLAVVLFALAFYQTYRSHDKASPCENGVCDKSNQLRDKALLWIAAGAVLLFTAFPYYSAALSRSFSKKSATPALARNPGSQTLRIQKIQVEGMTCGGCAESVRQAVIKLAGVASAAVTLERKEALVAYDGTKVTPQQMVEAITQSGFTASLR